MEVLKACLHPEPVKRLSAIEILSLPYFDDVHTLLQGTELQEQYDAAYTQAAEANAPSTPNLWTACSQCTAKRWAAAGSRAASPQGLLTASYQGAGSAQLGSISHKTKAMSPSTIRISAKTTQQPAAELGVEGRSVRSPSDASTTSASSTPSPLEGGAAGRRPHPPPGAASLRPSASRNVPSAVQQDVSAKHRASEGHFNIPSRSAASEATNGISATGVGHPQIIKHPQSSQI